MWIAIHFYHDNKAQSLLSDLIFPLSKGIVKHKIARQFFFVNYFDEEGLHIRLRLKTLNLENKISALTKIKNIVESAIHPGLPLKFYQFMVYEPETDRYGGEQALIVAERHFHYSSQTILKLLKRDGEKFSGRSITNALDMHLCMLYNLPLTCNEIEVMLSRILDGWIHSAVDYHRRIRPSQNDGEEILNNITSAFTQSFERQKDAIVEHCRILWIALKNQEKLKSPLNSWNNDVKLVHTDLTNALKEIPISDVNLTLDGRAIRIYESYIHMTNNRLGISNTDEAFIAYILLEVWTILNKNYTLSNATI